MNGKYTILLVLVLLAVVATGASCGSSPDGRSTTPAVPAESEARILTPQTTCPVMGGEIDSNLYADHNGKRVYFCCAACEEEFEAEPEKYIRKLKEQGVDIEDVLVE